MKSFFSGFFKRRTAIQRLSSDIIIGVVISIIATIIINFFPTFKDYFLRKINIPLFVLLLTILITFLLTLFLSRSYYHITIDKLKEDASKDRFLTKAYAKNQGPIFLEKRIHDASIRNESFSVIYLDIDDFKLINEVFGHDAADFVLQQFVERILPRSEDEYLIREGGEEFLIITKLREPYGAAIEGFGFANRVKNEVQKDPFLLIRGKGETYNLTISCGVAEFIKGDTTTTLKNRAEFAMREAKKTKNSVILSE